IFVVQIVFSGNLMQDWLAARAIATPEKIALVDGSITLRYQHLQDEVTRMCIRMEAAGIQRGDHIGMLMMSSALAVVPFFAALRMGLVFVPLSQRLTAEELDFQLRQSDCKWLLPYGTADTLAALRDKGHTLANLDHRIDQKRLPAYRDADIILENPALIVHTSGTSGKPKGAVLTAGNLFYSAMSSAYRIGHLPDDKWLCVLPLNHVGGLSILVRAVLYGITVDLREKFEVQAINHALMHDDISLISLVPTMLYRLLEHGTPERWSHLRMVLLGGAAGTPELLEKAQSAGVKVATTYGMTETTSQIATLLPDAVLKKPASVGRPLMFTQVRVVDENGADQAVGDFGEVLIRGETVMQGYYK
ncbi:MAG: AMP-binding protein, partial [Anaerolineae bacterium]|nr:AMP-binding protein [Anaerolineae bacterium]